MSDMFLQGHGDIAVTLRGLTSTLSGRKDPRPMFICILMFYLYKSALKLLAISALKALKARMGLRRRPSWGTAKTRRRSNRDEKGRHGPDVSPEAARDPLARNPLQTRSLRAPQAGRPDPDAPAARDRRR